MALGDYILAQSEHYAELLTTAGFKT